MARLRRFARAPGGWGADLPRVPGVILANVLTDPRQRSCRAHLASSGL